MNYLKNIVDWLERWFLTPIFLFLLGAIVLIVALYAHFLWTPSNKEFVQLNNSLIQKEAQLYELESMMKQVADLQRKSELLQSEFGAVALKFPKEREVPTLIQAVYLELLASGLEPILFSKRNKITKKFYVELPIKIEVAGTFFEIATFFDKISRLPRTVNIKDINLKRSESSNGKASILNAQFTATTFILLPPSVAKKSKGSVEKKIGKINRAPTAFRKLLYSPRGKRDPFKPFIQETEKEKERGAVLTDIPPVKRYPLEKYKIVGIVWVDGSATATVSDPQENVYFLGIEDEIGNENGKIIKITNNGLLVEETVYSKDEFGKINSELKRSLLPFVGDGE